MIYKASGVSHSSANQVINVGFLNNHRGCYETQSDGKISKSRFKAFKWSFMRSLRGRKKFGLVSKMASAVCFQTHPSQH